MIRRALVVASALVALACIPKAQPVKAKSPLPVAVACLHGSAAAPAEVSKEILAELAARNLRPKLVPVEALGTRRTTGQRMAALSTAAGEADLLVLVETDASFYSVLNGRYRWTVGTRMTMGRRGEEEVSERAMDVASFLDYEHQKEADALAAAAGRIGAELGRLADDYLGGSGDAEIQRQSGREKAPGDAIYFVMVDRFANGDRANDGDADPKDPQGWHGGDLKGVLQKIDWLADLGVGTVWLSPIADARTEKFGKYGAYHGYWVEDVSKVEPRFGTEQDLIALREALHARGMKLVLDVVLNHVGPGAPLTREHPDWFHGKGSITDWHDRAQLESHDVHGLPDLAQENPAVYAHLLSTSLGWIDRVKPNGFRLDAARHVPMEFWRKWVADVRAHAGPGFLLLGEMYDGDAAGLARTLREARFDAVFDFPLYFAMNEVFCKGAPAARLGATLSQDRLYADSAQLVTFLDSHDVARAMSACGGDVSKVEAALTFQLAARGTPAITWGTEVGLEGAEEPANRPDMRFDRTHPLRAVVRRQLALRQAHPVLVTGTSRMLAAEKDVFAYARVSDREVAIVVVNLGKKTRSVAIPGDLLARASRTEREVRAPAGKTTIVFLEANGKRGFTAAPAPAASRKIEFVVSGAPLGKGEQLVIVGSAPELGAWNPDEAVLVRGGRAQVELPDGVVLEWKLAARGGATTRWEDGTNRPLLVDAKAATVTAAWRE